MGWHRLAGIGACAMLHHLLEGLKGEAVAPHVDQGAYNGPHHIAEKAVSGNLKIISGGGGLHPTCRHHVAESGLVVGPGLTESLEILDLQEPGRGLVHQVEVERPMGLHRVMAKEGIALRMDEVAVSTACGRVTGVKVDRDRFYLLATDVARQHPVEPVGQLWGINLLLPVEMAHHLSGMYTRIGTAGSGDLDVLSEQQ